MTSHFNASNIIVAFTVFVVFCFLYYKNMKLGVSENPRDFDYSKIELNDVEKWAQCVKLETEKGLERVGLSWYFFRFGISKCLEQSGFSKIPISGLGPEFEFSETDQRFQIFNEAENTIPRVIVTFGLSQQLSVEEYIKSKLPLESRIYGSFMSGTNSTMTADRIGVKYQVDDGDGDGKLNLEQFLKGFVNESLIDQLSINEPTTHLAPLFPSLSNFTICQLNILLSFPDELQKKEHLGFLSKLLEDHTFIILSFSNQRVFLVNGKDMECRDRYVTPFIASTTRLITVNNHKEE